MDKLTDIEIIAELWRRRVAWLWKMSEVTAYRELDIEWVDEQIDKDEEAKRANRARKAP